MVFDSNEKKKVAKVIVQAQTYNCLTLQTLVELAILEDLDLVQFTEVLDNLRNIGIEILSGDDSDGVIVSEIEELRDVEPACKDEPIAISVKDNFAPQIKSVYVPSFDTVSFSQLDICEKDALLNNICNISEGHVANSRKLYQRYKMSNHQYFLILWKISSEYLKTAKAAREEPEKDQYCKVG